MKKGLFLLLVLVSILVGCSKKVYDSKNESTSQNQVNDSHTAQNSLDYKGSYHGILPCADCEGIETRITLSDESKYVLVRKYVGTDKKEFKSEGTYSWSKEGNILVLGDKKDAPNKYLVGENTLTALDAKGNKISGDLANKYVLTKKDVPVGNIVNAPFAGSKFVLVAVEGNPVVQGQRSCSALFEKSGRFTAFAGCNNIMGQYQASGNAVKFSKVAASRMVCPDMNTEQQFLKCLDMVTTYTQDESGLYFSKSDGKIVLYFKKMY